jgi:NADPH:quinone reductase-like Zn-dependent oxidoreductase
MKAIVMTGFGDPSVLRLAEVPTPAPGQGEVRVQVGAVAVARTKDVSARAGRPPFGAQITRFPHILGTEHAGVVDAVGAGVDHALLGQRVGVSAVLSCGTCRACEQGHEEACATFSLVGVHRQGSYAEYVVVPVANLSVLPAQIGIIDAAALTANGPVARAQLDAGRVDRESTVLVIGAGGSLGSMAVALADYRGAHVIGVDRLSAHPGTLDGLPLIARLDGDSPDLGAQLAEVAGPWGIDCVVDNIGVPSVWEAYRGVVADMGCIVVSGAINHEPLPMRMLPFYLRSQSLIGVRTGNRGQMAELWQDVANGFRPPASHIHAVPWLDAAAAHRRIEDGTAKGQCVLTVT